MTVGVVHRLEVIDVAEEQREPLPAARGEREVLVEPRLERAVVREAGEPVGGGEPLGVLVEPRAQDGLRGLEREQRELTHLVLGRRAIPRPAREHHRAEHLAAGAA